MVKQLKMSIFMSILLALGMGSVNAQVVRDVSVEEANRILVIRFYDHFFNQHQVNEAATVVAQEYK